MGNTQKKQSSYNYLKDTMDRHMCSSDAAFTEVASFNRWICEAKKNDHYVFELPRQANTDLSIHRHFNQVIDFSSYDYLGLAKHPAVLDAASGILQTYGLGATGSPILSGTMDLHLKLEKTILDYFDCPKLGVSLFTTTTTTAFILPYEKFPQFILHSRGGGGAVSANPLFPVPF